MWSFFWYAFSRIQAEHGNLQSKSSYSVRIWENLAQKNSVFGLYLQTEHKSLERKFSYSVRIREIMAQKKLLFGLYLCSDSICYLFTEAEYLDNSEFFEFFQDIMWKSNIFRFHGRSFVSHGFPRFLRKYSRLIIQQNCEKQKSWIGRQTDWELHTVSQHPYIFHGSNKHIPKPVSATRSNKLVSSLKVH